jgi:hypothetical protein
MVAATATLRMEALETRILSVANGIVKIKLGDQVIWEARLSRGCIVKLHYTKTDTERHWHSI